MASQDTVVVADAIVVSSVVEDAPVHTIEWQDIDPLLQFRRLMTRWAKAGIILKPRYEPPKVERRIQRNEANAAEANAAVIMAECSPVLRSILLADTPRNHDRAVRAAFMLTSATVGGLPARNRPDLTG
ncbi:predicted protein [Chaetomium globosum CBS 148.51]|uniref:Uncharacterized protein n=1 Tax=Chaetomium globosum (strain ATCC 6205 / CBS 148.51 / DSM 1962 / NBRC 6347 / NRRL 1970) TaxID=306901 RepID=Q2HBV8_CHAGB|nr:uncharacterized protein CHGG_02296 [Chaetomium globosum CBS 148.51]EAQ90361.1 predicted protein [Chaetomium globosum CBS 148.51]